MIEWMTDNAWVTWVGIAVLLAVADLQADAVIGWVRLGDHVEAFFDKHRRHFFDGRAHRGLEETVHLIP